MQRPYLQMQSTYGKIGLQTSRPTLQIRQPKADLTIHQQHVDTIKISKRASKLYIDQTEAFADAHLKGPLRSSNEFIAKTKSSVAQYISKTARQGDQMMRIENSGNVFPSISAANAHIYPEKGYNIGFMPKNAFQVKFNYQPSELNFQVSRSEPDIRVKKNDPNISIPKWQTNAYVREKNNLNIHAVGLQVNLQR